MKLTDFAEEINKCSKCGKCQEVCPVYKLTGNDCAVSRGKFVMLRGVLNGDLKLNKNIVRYLNMCLKCGKCKDFCPSDIDVCKIFSTAKSEYEKNTLYGKIIRFLQSEKIFNNFLNCGRVFRRTKLETNGQTKLLYFKGCVNKLYPKSENSLKKILSRCDAELIEKDFECCGLPFLSSGNLDRFEEVKARNIELLNGSYDYIITDCASCESTLKSYAPPDVHIINVCHYLAIQKNRYIFNKPLKVTFHKPCHLESSAFIKPLFEKCENVEYIEADGYDECCGFAGEFALKNPEISRKLSKRKAENLAKTNADIILTVCPSCIAGIYQGFIGKHRPKVMNITDFLAQAKIEQE